MGNIRDYLKEQGCYTLDERPFSEVDNLIMSYLVYYNFMGIVPRAAETIGIKEAADLYKKRIGGTQKNVVSEFLGEVAQSKRFKDIRLSDFMYRLEDSKRTVQFTALHIILNDDLHYIAYRGIAEEYVGWYEAFKMSYSVIPAQVFSLAYLERILRREKREDVRYLIGGHSKGGAQAAYAAAACDESLKKYISAVYSNDGPAVREAVLSPEENSWLRTRLIKIVPKCSVVGMIFEKNDPDIIVESCETGLTQHEPMSWQVEGNAFVRAERLDEEGAKVCRAINKWNDSLKQSERKAFVNEVFGYLRHKPHYARLKIDKLFSALSPESRRAAKEMMKAAVSCRINLKHLLPAHTI